MTDSYRIWGTPIIAYCTSKEKALPDNPRELYSMSFEDLSVSFTGVDSDKKVAFGFTIHNHLITTGNSKSAYSVDGRKSIGWALYHNWHSNRTKLRTNSEISSDTLCVSHWLVFLGCYALAEASMSPEDSWRDVEWWWKVRTWASQSPPKRLSNSSLYRLCKLLPSINDFYLLLTEITSTSDYCNQWRWNERTKHHRTSNWREWR